MITQRWSFFDLLLALLFRQNIQSNGSRLLKPYFLFLKKENEFYTNFHIQKAELHKHSKTIQQFVFIENHSLDIPSSNTTGYRLGHELERWLQGFDFKIIEEIISVKMCTSKSPDLLFSPTYS